MAVHVTLRHRQIEKNMLMWTKLNEKNPLATALGYRVIKAQRSTGIRSPPQHL